MNKDQKNKHLINTNPNKFQWWVPFLIVGVVTSSFVLGFLTEGVQIG